MRLPALSLRARRLACLLVLGALGVLVLSIGAWGAEQVRNDSTDLRNIKGGEKNGGIPSLDCWAHHRGEGMYDSHAILPIFPVQALPGTTDAYKVQVVNTWKYDISELLVEMTLKGNETFVLPTAAEVAEPTPNFFKTWEGQLSNKQLSGVPTGVPFMRDLPFPVQTQAAALTARLELRYPDGPAAGALGDDRFFVKLFPPAAKSFHYSFTPRNEVDATATVRTLDLDPKFLTSGAWRFNLEFDGGHSPYVDYTLNVTVLYAGGATGQTYRAFYSPLVPGPDGPEHPLALIKPKGVYDVEIPVQHLTKGTQEIEIHVRALLYYRHQDGKTPDLDYFNRYATATVVVGDQRIESPISGATAGTPGDDARLVVGEVSGFASAFLLLPSLLLGGTYGRASRKLFNRLVGGAKRRVMYHNLSSLGLTLIAVVHIVMFMLEVRYTVLMGVLWGGLAALALLVLGLTGYYQVPLIQKYGYNWWRYVHLAFGILVVAFVGYHAFVDGPDFDFLRKALTEDVQKFIQGFNLAYK